MDKNSLPENCSGAPGSITLGDRTFVVAQHTPADLMAIRRRLKKHVKPPLQMYADMVSDPNFRKLPKKVRDELAAEAGRLKMRGEVALTADMADDMLQQAEHCRHMAWLLLRRAHPELRLEELTPLITDDNAPQVFAELLRESGMSDLGE